MRLTSFLFSNVYLNMKTYIYLRIVDCLRYYVHFSTLYHLFLVTWSLFPFFAIVARVVHKLVWVEFGLYSD